MSSSSSKLPHPKVYETASGLLLIGTLAILGLLWLLNPPLRPMLDAVAPFWAWMLLAAMAGMLLRVGHDLQAGKNWINTYALKMTMSGLAFGVIAIWQALHLAAAPTGLNGLEDVGAALLRLLGVFGVCVAFTAGLRDGDDETWRQRQARQIASIIEKYGSTQK